MNLLLHKRWNIRPDVERAIVHQQPIVALETAVVTHGLPFPTNLALAQKMEQVILEEKALPATIGVLDGKVQIGLNENQLAELADPKTEVQKISQRDFGIALVSGFNGGTTVGGTMVAASKAGIRIFATGGIGGVHREPAFDVSADLMALNSIPMIVVCSGAKSILNLSATIEVLESYGVPVIGYKTDEFPAFYAAESGLPVTTRVDSVKMIAKIAREQWRSGLRNAILVVQPPPQESALPAAEMETIIQAAIEDARNKNIFGAALTPYLLDRINQLSEGRSMFANLALLENNARLAAKISRAYYKSRDKMI
ncbi:MAG: pseudouridine-5'-phosphate glycosidase [Anaerolineaceae bacterium]|nr:pseudouridine-5'-phosphate glycosidase [Anaerolineaceae bacterium]